jgi:hypothetical protein
MLSLIEITEIRLFWHVPYVHTRITACAGLGRGQDYT